MGIALACVVAALVCVGIFVRGATAEPPVIWEAVEAAAQFSQPEYRFQESAPASSEAPDDGLPKDKLFITGERQRYEDKSMTLKIPKLDIDIPLWNGTGEENLKKGACLYEYAQLPGEGDRNVSIAAHRNGIRNGKPTDSAPFYYIDTLAEGDYLYLSHGGNIYRYSYESSFVVGDEDWGPIYSQGFSCLTLTTCTPVSVTMTPYRLVVRGKLDQVFPDDGSFEYLAAAA